MQYTEVKRCKNGDEGSSSYKVFRKNSGSMCRRMS